MKAKKILSIASAVMLGAAALAGCGSGGSTQTTGAGTSSKSVTTGTETAGSAAASATSAGDSGDASMVFAWWGNQTRNDRTQSAIDLYESQNPGVSIDGQFSQWGDYWQKLATASTGGQLPDIVQMDYSYLNQYAQSNLLLDLNPYLENGMLDSSKWDQNMITAATIDGKFLAVCNGINVPAMVYDKNLTDKAGVTIKDNMSVEEFVQAARAVYEKTGYRTALQYPDCSTLLEYWARADDVVFYGDGKINSTEEQLTRYFQIIADGISEGWLLDSAVYADRAEGSIEQEPLVYGDSPSNRAWNTLCWSNQYTALTAMMSTDQDFEITTWPTPNSKKSNYLKPSQFFAVSANTQNPEAAVKFLNYLINSTECNDILLGERGVPLNSDVAAEVEKQLGEDDKKIYDFVYDVVQPSSSVINPPNPDGAAEVRASLKAIMEELCYSQIDAAAAAQRLLSEANAILSAKTS